MEGVLEGIQYKLESESESEFGYSLSAVSSWAVLGVVGLLVLISTVRSQPLVPTNFWGLRYKQAELFLSLRCHAALLQYEI
jgi:hypothetical protein